ncbi:low-density lipoprotein receptor-related protein 4 [Agrilus planipennis]|uniref:Low-density lipoprotein receptor-related protein 4 n=1 Tax=Agrilus planipennis TaxID=224129 RepID=A0A7F5RBF5_AGRPL|nr:low-density lipoprotein receptor-related protein 4 [Agrilus planipennis]
MRGGTGSSYYSSALPTIIRRGCYVTAFYFLFTLICKCQGESVFALTTTASPHHFPHRGAARQMYGSGLQRSAGDRPFTVRNIGYRRIPPRPVSPPTEPIFPYTFLKRHPIPINIFPHIYFPKGTIASSSRNGGILGVGKGRSNHDIQPEGIDEDDVRNHERYEEECTCGPGQIPCPGRTCFCITKHQRCDGIPDCEGEEDELQCEEEEKKCEDLKNHVKCPQSGKCISKDWLCDGDDDCGDFSDETHCGGVVNCTDDQFECTNGLCIPFTWVCDNDNDCKDFSDEIGCNKTDGCTQDEFSCADGSCISKSWRCDNERDCPDGSDEDASCASEELVCNPESEFQCSFQKCIKHAFRCDGDNDCGDWSDEEDCQSATGNCVAGEFKCKSGKCIPERFRCDKQKDCEDDDDEANCNYDHNVTCSPEEFTCSNGACILKKWICDGVPDCNNGEDEVKCNIVCEKSKFACMGAIGNETFTDFCIGKKHVCDGQKNCPRGEDEKNCPTKRQCNVNDTCAQECITSANGKSGCACRQGFELGTDGVSCEDIDECAYETEPVCSQKCTNSVGSFNCDCMTGYILRPDLRTCKALGGSPTLIFANRVDIRQVSLQKSSSKYTAILKGLHNAIALDYHYEKGLIFWSDLSLDVIRKTYTNGTGIEDVIRWGLESPSGIAVDWIHNLIFWTDSGTRRIEVATLDGMQRAILVASDLDKPRAIAVHPGEAYVFWTDWGPFPKIERLEMDGTNRISIITESIFWPNGLTIDYTSSRIYWADAKHSAIESSLFNGRDRKKVVSRGLPHPFALTLFEDAVYWTDWHTKSISTANKATGAGLTTLHSHLHFPMDIHSFHPQRQPAFPNHCGNNNGGCQHMCLPANKNFTCACHMGLKLASDGKKCKIPTKFLIFARNKDLRIKHIDEEAAHQHEMVIPLDGLKSAIALAWDSKEDYIFWTDVEKDTISRVHWNGSDQRVLVHTNIQTPAGLDFDWITRKLYWTDTERERIEVANIDGSMRSLLIWEGLEKPHDIVVDPLSGYMFWSEWREKPKIERAAMDGTQRKSIIISNLDWPNGLAVDHSNGKLYWTDGGEKRIEYSNFDGSDRKVLISTDLLHPFGLDIYGDFVYWSDLSALRIESANKLTGLNRTVLESGISNLTDVRIFHRKRTYIDNPCSKNNGNCSHLCFLKPKGYSCGCPTGIKLLDDKRTCPNGPKSSLILAHRTYIRQISLDVPYIEDVVLPFSSLKNVVSVDIDRNTGLIYWADTAEDGIYKATLDGTKVRPIIYNEVQMVEGIAVDSSGRKIYWTDGKRNSIEVSELNGLNRRLLVWKGLDKPRAITLHYREGLMFWSDWGTTAKIEKAYMDGSNRIAIITAGVKWPNGLAIDSHENRLYWNDGKSGKIECSDFNGNGRKTILTEVPHPYGLVVVDNHIYWTDWKTQGLHQADKFNGTNAKKIRGNLELLMDVRAVQKDKVDENACGNNNGGCSHLCLRRPDSFTCACETGVLMTKNGKICEKQPTKYIFFSTRSSLVRISLDTEELWDVTLPVGGIFNAINVDFHWKKRLLFFTDDLVIKSVNMHNLSDVREVIKDLVTANGLAVDWIANNLYWIDASQRVVGVTKIGPGYQKILINEDLEDPRSIAVFPSKGLMYFSDWGGKPKIERSFLDGSGRKVLIVDELRYPTGLTLDYEKKRLYWSDYYLDRIESSDLNGQNRIQLIHPKSGGQTLEAPHPFGLTLYEDSVYWTDWKQKTVKRANKSTGKNITTIRDNLDGAVGITVVTESRQTGWNPCSDNNGQCSHFCFFKVYNYTCGCPNDPKITDCSQEPAFWVFFKVEPLDEMRMMSGSKNDDNSQIEEDDTKESEKLFLLTFLPIMLIIIITVLVVFVVLYKKNKKKLIYSTGRRVMAFSNPNYYSSNNENPSNSAPTDKKSFLWKRIKYDKSQDRVYEEKVGTASPEVTSLIPTVLTPSSSNCEAITPELGRSPFISPIHQISSIHPSA